VVVDFDDEELVVDDKLDLLDLDDLDDGITTMTTSNLGFFKVPPPIVIAKKAKL
jgi:hypothetical protein